MILGFDFLNESVRTDLDLGFAMIFWSECELKHALVISLESHDFSKNQSDVYVKWDPKTLVIFGCTGIEFVH